MPGAEQSHKAQHGQPVHDRFHGQDLVITGRARHRRQTVLHRAQDPQRSGTKQNRARIQSIAETMRVIWTVRFNQPSRVLPQAIRRFLEAQQFPQQISQHQSQESDGQLLGGVAKSAANAKPGEPQPEDQSGRSQHQLKEVLGLGGQRRGTRQADNPADDDTRRVQNCSRHGLNEPRPVPGEKGKVDAGEKYRRTWCTARTKRLPRHAGIEAQPSLASGMLFLLIGARLSQSGNGAGCGLQRSNRLDSKHQPAQSGIVMAEVKHRTREELEAGLQRFASRPKLLA